MNDIDKLTEYFKEFPGIGPRQAKRFVYFLLRKNPRYADELSQLIPRVRKQVTVCNDCSRYFVPQGAQTVCAVCSDSSRNPEQLMIVSRDTDFEAVEKSDTYHGYYFILGGTLPILEEHDAQKYIRLDELESVLDKRTAAGLKEIIIALNANPDGDNTARFLKEKLAPRGITISILGRGLSTGSELEYADSDTIKHALKNRA
ncbi:MAG: recombination protein RecR, recombination protein RecR [Candidatus Parcubacteria bacterium]|jgi:recombination protein RecR